MRYGGTVHHQSPSENIKWNCFKTICPMSASLECCQLSHMDMFLIIYADQKEFEGLSKMRFINVILWWKVRPMQRGCASDLLWHRDLYWQHNHEFICREGWRCDSWLAKFFILTHDSHQYFECWARIWTDAVFPGANLPIESRTTNWVLQTRCKLFMKNMFTLKVLPGTHFINGQFFSLRDSSPDRIFSHIYHFFPIGSTL